MRLDGGHRYTSLGYRQICLYKRYITDRQTLTSFVSQTTKSTLVGGTASEAVTVQPALQPRWDGRGRQMEGGHQTDRSHRQTDQTDRQIRQTEILDRLTDCQT